MISRIKLLIEKKRSEIKSRRDEKKREENLLFEKRKKEKKEKLLFQLVELKVQLDKEDADPIKNRSIVENKQKFYADRFLKDNERIWTITSIFLPLSLAGLSQLKDKSLTTVILLGLGSMALISFWYLATEKLRNFQDRNEEALDILDLYLGFDKDIFSMENGAKKSKSDEESTQKSRKEKLVEWAHSNKLIRTLKSITIQRARLYMYYFVVCIWLIGISHAIYRNFYPTTKNNETININVVDGKP